MKSLTSFQGIVLMVFGVAALIGLFVFASYTSKGGGGSTVGTVVIWGTLPQNDMNAALAAASQTSQTLKGVSYVQKDESSLPADLAAAIATGHAPDLVLASQEDLLSLAPLLTPVPLTTLSARSFTSAFIAGGSIYTAPQGAGYYGVPFLVDPLSLFFNRAILSSAGIAKPPASWEAITGLVPQVATLTPARAVTRSFIALGSYANVHDARGILSALFLQTGVPVTTPSASGAVVASLGQTGGTGTPPGEAVLNFYTQFADPSKVSYNWNASLPDSQQAFLSGDLALYLGYASEARYLAAANPNLSFDMAPVPQPATATNKADYGLIYAFMAPRGAANASGAYQAAVLLTNTAEENAAAAATGLAPASLTALSSAPTDPILATAYSEALYSVGWLSPAPAATDQAFSSMITSVTSGSANALNALSATAQSLNALLPQ